MKGIRRLVVIVMLGLVPFAAFSEEEKTSIIAATVEDTVAAQMVRLVVSPSVKEDAFKIVCGEGMIRVRLTGIANRGREIEELDVPGNGPLHRVRIIEKNPKNAVLQIIPRHQPQTTCSRTSVVVTGGEIIVSTARSDAEVARYKAASEAAKSDHAALLPSLSSDRNAKKIETILKGGAAEGTASEASEKIDTAENNSKLAFKGSDPNATKSAMPSGQGVMSAPKAAFGFGFAALVAGLALYFKKKKRFAIDELENIEIISTKRLGLKQQLMLVSVQGVKFLLAVGEKTVSALGTVPEASRGDRAVRALLEEAEASQPKSSATENVSEVLEQLIGEASRHAALPVADALKNDRARFNEELGRALQHNLERADGRGRHRPPITISEPKIQDANKSEQSAASASNAAGLVALARMRANIRKNTGKSQVFEA